MLLALGCDTNEPEPEPETGCNGAELLCGRRVDEVAYLRTHNSHASEERGYEVWSRNQFEAIPTQLSAGVRSLNVDVYVEEGQVLACHGYCSLGSQAFDEVLEEIGDFLRENPRELLLLDLQDETQGEARDTLALSDLPFAVQQPGQPWPTLGELVDADTRLYVFSKSASGDEDWFHPYGSFLYSTGWQYEEPEDLDCAASPFEHGLYEVTHVLTNPLSHPDNAEAINHHPVLREHIERCQAEVGFVNQVSVDYYSIGEGLDYIDELNGVSSTR